MPVLLRKFWFIPILVVCGVVVWLANDWYRGLPPDRSAQYVGRSTCAECHQQQTELYTGSHHDLAMAPATPDTVLGDFNDARLEHHGQQSRMYRDGDRYMVQTEGPDGQPHDYQVEYVFGVKPLQQYIVSLDSPPATSSPGLGRLQILRISWDTERKQWYYLDPPDVHSRLEPDDPLHWTRIGQNWNHMCADCHSTNVRKNFDPAAKQYHTTFSEIDVSCEACHGPGSLHVELARARSPFWDRRLGYGLAKLKSTDPQVEIESCAPCHSRRSMIAAGPEPGQPYHDHFTNELLQPGLYYPDGQIRDEVYEYGSFLQSKMHAKGIRCTDCHDPHSARLKHTGNQVCTSCHTHSPAKYDSPAHHHHQAGSAGAQCVNCHMPDRPYMEVDFRRDHSLRIPRPDLSVQLETPNACTQCHLPTKELPESRRAELPHYAAWLDARDAGDATVRALLAKTDQWANEWFVKWYGPADYDPPSFGPALDAAWKRQPDAGEKLQKVLRDLRYPPIVRASALYHLAQVAPEQAVSWITRGLDDPQVLIRGTAVSLSSLLAPTELYLRVVPLLRDPIRWVRTEAARATAATGGLSADDQAARDRAVAELKQMWSYHSDLSGSYVDRGQFHEQAGEAAEAVIAYGEGIRIEPDMAGPRSNLAALLEQQGQVEGANQLRADEFVLLERDAQRAPDLPAVQYRYAMALYLKDRPEEALKVVQRCVELAPREAQYWLALKLLNEKLGRPAEAQEADRRMRELTGPQP
ncbi:MAG: multiheme c-type cytochrome [Pirellulales bacterium]